MQPDNSTMNYGGQVTLDRAGSGENSQQFITFTLGAEEYGIDIMVVREIKGWTDTTMIPNAPAHVRGVINLRGVIVPIFDLRARFGAGLTKAIRPIPEMGLPTEDQFLDGLVAMEDRMVTLVSLSGLFGNPTDPAKRNIASELTKAA
jgi:purine-binding chemotaxis protein CheW